MLILTIFKDRVILLKIKQIHRLKPDDFGFIMSIVRQFVEQGYAKRIQSLANDACPIPGAVDMMSRWSHAGAMTIFMAGVFDLPTPNHRFGLAEARLIGGAILRRIDYGSLTADSTPELIDEVWEAAASDNVKLMVSATLMTMSLIIKH